MIIELDRDTYIETVSIPYGTTSLYTAKNYPVGQLITKSDYEAL